MTIHTLLVFFPNSSSSLCLSLLLAVDFSPPFLARCPNLLYEPRIYCLVSVVCLPWWFAMSRASSTVALQ